MLDAALIGTCADPSLTPAIVEQFVQVAGSPDPLTVTVRSGGRLILIPKANTSDEAMDIIRQHVGKAVVRVGLTQYPAGVGVKDPSEIKPDVVDACENLKIGTQMFAKILRIVAKWYGNPRSDDILPQIFEDAVHAWKTGEFEGVSVFQAQDPVGAVELPQQSEVNSVDEEGAAVTASDKQTETNDDVDRAGIRIDLSRVGGN